MLIRLNQIMRGWANFFKHAVCKHTLGNLAHFAWWRVVRWLRTLHRWRWKDVRRAFTTPEGRWKPVTADGIELFNLETVPVTRYRYRGSKIPTPLGPQPRLTRQEPWRARYPETGTPGSASGLGRQARVNPGTAPQAGAGPAEFGGGWTESAAG